MAAPPKLWERQRQHINQRQPIFNPDSNNSFMQSSPFLPPGGGGGGGGLSPALAPPLPPRPPSTSLNTYGRPTYGSFSSYGGGYGNYGGGTYGGGYGNYGRYGMIGHPSNMPVDENGFIQLAEESSRPAFESIESIVHAFGSVSMMLESTYHAVHSSFRAVLGVAEHFGRMKSHFAQIFSALAVVRTLRWVYKKLLYLIGLRLQDPSLETAWQNSGASSLPLINQITEADIKASKSSWPIVMFLAVVFSGPYLIWRLLSSLVPTRTSSKAWIQGQGEHFPAQALHNFKAGGRYELTLNAGQQLFLAPRDQQPSVRGWLLASNGRTCGLVPANYIKIFRTGLATNPNPSPGSSPGPSPMMHPQGLNQGPGQARRMPAPTNPHMTGQMPNIMPSPHHHPPNQLPQNNMPYPAQHPSNPRLPHIQPPNSQPRQASIPHPSSNPLPPHSQPHPVSQYQSNLHPPHTQTHPQQPGHPSGVKEELMNDSESSEDEDEEEEEDSDTSL